MKAISNNGIERTKGLRRREFNPKRINGLALLSAYILKHFKTFYLFKIDYTFEPLIKDPFSQVKQGILRNTFVKQFASGLTDLRPDYRLETQVFELIQRFLYLDFGIIYPRIHYFHD